MPSSQKDIVDCASAGEPTIKVDSSVQTIKFIVHNAKNATKNEKEYIFSPIVLAHGYKWRIGFCPNPSSNPSSNAVMCSLTLLQACDIDTYITFRVQGQNGQKKAVHMYKRFSEGFFWTTEIFIHQIPEESSCAIEVDIEILDRIQSIYTWYPEKMQQEETLVKLYHDASSDFWDIAFSVAGKVYYAHRGVLAIRGNKLFEISKEYDNKEPIPIVSMRPEVFKIILDSVYTLEPREIDIEDIAKELLVAADHYEFIYLKLYAESVIVEKFLTVENAAALLVFADSHSCALLKEASTNIIVSNMETVTKSEAWSQVSESKRLLNELLHDLSCYYSPLRVMEPDEFLHLSEIVSVSELRHYLEGANLELDGSREVLIKRLKTYYRCDKNKSASKRKRS